MAIDEMLRTVEEAMSQAINWWGDLPPPMKEAMQGADHILSRAGNVKATIRPLLEADRRKMPSQASLQIRLSRRNSDRRLLRFPCHP
jgi:hypothetical protein